MELAEPTTLYRLYNVDDALLYVGISSRWFVRMGEHAGEKTWWDDVVVIKRDVFPCRADAEAAEKQAIREESPLHNVRGAPTRMLSPPAHRPAISPPTPPPPVPADQPRVVEEWVEGVHFIYD